MTTHSGILPGKSHGQGSLVGYSPQGHKESGVTEPRPSQKMPFCKLTQVRISED